MIGGGLRNFHAYLQNDWDRLHYALETALIVAGGKDKGMSMLQRVEVLDIKTFQWSMATDLPQPLSHAPAAVCGDRVYFIGESNMYTCSVSSLIQPRKSVLFNFRDKVLGVWKEAAAPPVTNTACVSIHGQILAIGGKDSCEKPHYSCSFVQPDHKLLAAH